MNFIENEWIFVLLNLVVILLGSIIFFLVKEYSRVRRGELSNTGILVSGTLIGALLLLVDLYVEYKYTIVVSGPRDWCFLNEPNSFSTILHPSIIYLLIFGIFIDRRFVIPISIFLGIGYLIRFPKNFSSISLWSEFMFAIITLLILSILIYLIQEGRFIKNNGSKLILIFIIWILLITIFRTTYELINGFGVEFNSSALAKLISIETIYLTIFMFIQSEIIFFIERIYINFTRLESFSTQDDISYYKLSLAQNKLRELIDFKKINMGALVLFDIKSSDQNVISDVLKKIRNETKNEYKTTFFIKVSSNYYGAFYELPSNVNLDEILLNNKNKKRTKDDSLMNISNKLYEIEKNEKVKINSVASIYGIHSNDINELIELDKFLMSPIINRANANNLIVYDFKRIKASLKKKTEVSDLFVGIDDISINYIKGVSEENIYYPSIIFEKNKHKYLLDILENNPIYKENELLLRYSAYQTLRMFDKKGSLILYYYSMTLENFDFSIDEFIKKINRYSENENIIIGLMMNEISDQKKLSNNILELRNQGFRFALLNPLEAKQEYIDILNPEFLLDISDETNLLKISKQKLKIKTQAVRLNTYLV